VLVVFASVMVQWDLPITKEARHPGLSVQADETVD
jgi:hypothetical protein